MKYNCESCNYETNHKSNYKKHLNSIKHNSKFINKLYKCKSCSYTANKHNDYINHLETTIHSKYKCNRCNREYKTRNGLYKHNMKHTEDTTIANMINGYMKEQINIQKELLKLSKQPSVVNQTINIFNYLNTECKEAHNISDFIKDIAITMKDMENIIEYGYLKSMKLGFVKSIHDMGHTERPIHCTDIKRRQFYIRDDNIWKKDNTLIHKAINDFNNKQIKSLREYCYNDIDKMNILMHEVTKMYSDDGKKIKDNIIYEISKRTKI